MKSRSGTIGCIFFFLARMIFFSVQELDFFLVAQGCSLDIKGEKKDCKSYLQFFLRIVNSIETFTRESNSIAEGTPVTVMEQDK